jgi:hypothetical protein
MGETQYANYPSQMAKLQGWLSGFTIDNWTNSLYATWLYSLRPLLDVPGDGYPQFMQSEAWLDKQINTSLGSWAELRHDTILYAPPAVYPECGGGGRSPTGPSPLLARGYVEPVPLFYARLRALAATTRQGLASRGMLNEQDNDSLQEIESLAQSLQIISEKELSGTPLTDVEHSLIRAYGYEMENLVYAAATDDTRSGTFWNNGPPPAAVVADVAVADSTVLEEAVGLINPIYVVVPLINPDGSIMLEVTKGGIFSYYEFPWPVTDRMTDEAWREMLRNDSNPQSVPEWTSSFLTAETTDNSLRDAIYGFSSKLGWAYWYNDADQFKSRTSGRKVADFFSPIFVELEDDSQVIEHVYVNGSYRSFDYQSKDTAVVTVRETWQDKLIQVSKIDKEYGYHENQQVIGQRGPYTLNVTYTLKYISKQYDSAWYVTNAVYANEPPPWEDAK